MGLVNFSCKATDFILMYIMPGTTKRLRHQIPIPHKYMNRDKDIRTSENLESYYIDKHTMCISIIKQNLQFELKEHQIAPQTKKNSKRSEFLRFYLYFCHVIQCFICFYCNTKISEISDMAKSRATSVALILIEKYLILLLRKLG